MDKKIAYPILAALLCIITSSVIHAEFIRGVDISIQTRQDTDGVVYNENSVPQSDVLNIFKNHDVGWVRIRLFHTPSGSIYGVCQNLAYVTTLAARVKAAGFKFLLDIHYSDTWADPGQQTIPAAWSGYTHAQLVTAVHDYTRDVIIHLRTNGVMPEMVQIGNEITGGMLWPDGQLYGGSSSWANFVDLINAGKSGVNDGRGTETMPKIMLHIDRGGDWAGTQYFLDNIRSRGVVFDVLGQSFYPQWHGTLDNLATCLNNTAAAYPYDIVLAEVGEYYYSSSDATKTPANQKAFLEGVIQRLQTAPNGRGVGLFYWEPTWVWSSSDGYRALFQPISGNWRNVNMLMAMQAFDIPSTDFIPPDAPTGLSATAGSGMVSLNWNDNTEEDMAGYNVYRSTTSGTGYTRLNASLVSSSSYTDNTVFDGAIYYYVVTAVDTSDNESDNSSEVSAVPSGSDLVYTFTGITAANTIYNAYACDVDVFPFAGNSGNLNTKVEATDAQYVNIATNDSAEWATANPGSGDETFLWVEMKVNQLPANIAQIDLTFNSYTGTSAATHRIYVMTAGADWTQTASWTQVGADQSIPGSTYTTMTRSITSNISNYIDANGKITWAVYETTSAQVTHINYVEMAVYVIPNVSPTVSVTSPVTGSVFSQNANIIVEAGASDTDGTVTKVEFYQEAVKLGEDSTAPYSYTWNTVPTGNCTLTAVATDNDGAAATSSPVNITVLGAEGTGAILCQWWDGITGTSVSDLISDANYPDNTSDEALLVSLQGPANRADNYGTRIRGYLNPVTSGDYTFILASDADSELRLSTDDNPANASLIASMPGSPQSSLISFVAGQKYYIEVLHKEGTGDDNVSVSWQGPAISQQVIDGVYLSPCCLDFGSYANFAQQWNRSDCTAANAWCGGADRNRDGSVLLEDLLTFVNAWLLGIQ